MITVGKKTITQPTTMTKFSSLTIAWFLFLFPVYITGLKQDCEFFFFLSRGRHTRRRACSRARQIVNVGNSPLLADIQTLVCHVVRD